MSFFDLLNLIRWLKMVSCATMTYMNFGRGMGVVWAWMGVDGRSYIHTNTR